MDPDRSLADRRPSVRPPTDSYQTGFDLSSREPGSRPAALEATDHRNWAMTGSDQVAAATAAAAAALVGAHYQDVGNIRRM